MIVLCSPAVSSSAIRRAESLGIRYLDAFLREHGFSSAIVDAHCWGLNSDATADLISGFSPRLVGLQLIFHDQIPAAIELAQKIKARFPDVVIVTGGHVPTFSAAELLAAAPEIDFAVRGEGELALLEIAKCLDPSSEGQQSTKPLLRAIPGIAYLENGVLHQVKPADLIDTLDGLPFPTRDPRDYNEFRHASIIASRGCYARCTFCSVPQFFMLARGPMWRLRGVSNTIDEMEELSAAYGITHFSFVDDIFLGRDQRSQRRAREFASALKKRLPGAKFAIECRTDAVVAATFAELKSAGLERVFLGLEAGSDEALDLFNKWTDILQSRLAIEVLRGLGVAISFGFINFHPDSTLDSLRRNIEFLSSVQLSYPGMLRTRLIAYPGTPIWSTLKGQGRLRGDPLAPSYDFSALEVQQAFDGFKELFVNGKAWETQRKRAEFALSFVEGSEAGLRQRYNETCKELSDITANSALALLDAIATHDEPKKQDLITSLNIAVRPLCARFEEVMTLSNRAATPEVRELLPLQ